MKPNDIYYFAFISPAVKKHLYENVHKIDFLTVLDIMVGKMLHTCCL